MKAAEVVAYLRRRWWVVALLALAVVLSVWFGASALNDSKERRASRARIEASASEAADLAKRVEAQNVVITAQGKRLEQLLKLIENATSPEAQARGAANLAFAIAELRREALCAALDDEATYLACAEVSRRMDAIRAGADPFARPTPTTTPGAPA